jgi:hypothetical protein
VIDTWSGSVYPGLKVCYETLLAEREIDGAETRSYLRLRRAFPGRFVAEGEEDWGSYFGFIEIAEEACRQQAQAPTGVKPGDKGYAQG